MGEPNLGDRVVVETAERRFIGVVMPRPSLAGRDYITLKLESGYNVGVPRKDIVRMSIVEENTPKGVKAGAEPSFLSGKPLVSIISTGGTVSSRVDYRTGGVYAASTVGELLTAFPELREVANIRAVSLMNVMSEDMTPGLWSKMASCVCVELNSGADGVVITHGTDTMHYSSAALSFLLPNLGKPVVLTGAQRSTDRGSSDTYMNLVCSTVFAVGDYAGVYIVMHGSLNDDYCLVHNGSRVQKMHTTRRDAFKSINAKPVAKVYSDGRIQEVGGPSRKRTNVKSNPDLSIEEKVALIRVYPGMDPEIIDFYMTRGYRGLVFEGTALGHVPTTLKETSIIPKIEQARDSGIIMVMTTQCLHGRVHPLVYSNLREVSSRGVIYCEDMLPETAYVKLMWVLGHTKRQDEIREMMLTNYVGEISPKTLIDEETTNF